MNAGRQDLPSPPSSPAQGLLACAAAVFLALDLWFVLPTSLRVAMDSLNAVFAAGFCGIWISDVLASRRRGEAVRKRRAELALLTGSALFAVLLVALPEETRASFASMLHQRTGLLISLLLRLFLWCCVGLQALRLGAVLLERGARPEVLLPASFLAVIAVSGLLLMAPKSAADPSSPISPVDAIFTATSAVCVTGLTVRDTGAHFTGFGQAIILATIQIGGIGIISFICLLASLSSRRLPISQMVAFQQAFNTSAAGDFRKKVLSVIGLTAAIEAAGTISLLIFREPPPHDNPAEPIWWAVFHSVSAFCNAGFGLAPDNLEHYAGSPGILLTIAILIIAGGLGFLILPELISKVADKIASARGHRGPVHRLSVQTKISLVVTVFLLALGTAGFWALEAGGTGGSRDPGQAALNAFFQSVTTRTAGFNSVPIGKLRDSTLALMIALMVVGGCAVSTAGGIKTSTLGVLALAMKALLRGRDCVEAFGRTLPRRAILMASTVFFLYAITASSGFFVLSILEPKAGALPLAFEAVSALSTVGLSTGITPGLGDPAKLVLCALMFAGRVGPISVVISVFRASGSAGYDFPEEDVVVG